MASTEKQKAYQRAYYLGHRESIVKRTTANKLRWQKENPELAAEKSRAYHKANAEKIAERKRAQRLLTKDAQREYAKRYYIANAEKRLANARKWHAENSEVVRLRRIEWESDNRDKIRLNGSRRRARRMDAMPQWADPALMLEFYTEAVRLTRETGIPHEVDHIVPLQGRMVCGLHCPNNLQVLTKWANLSKHNRFPLRG